MTTITSSPASMDKMPPEILIQILEETASLDATDRLHRDTLPASLFFCSQVDRRWNIIAKAPSLYKEIRVPFKALCERRYNSAKWLQTWLERSNPYLVQLDIQLEEDIHREIYQFHGLLKSLIPHASRLKRISITAFDEVTLDLALLFDPLKHVDAPVLEEIEIHHTKNSCTSTRRVAMRSEPVGWSCFFWSAPNLRRVTVLGAVTERPLVRLTYLEMCNVVLNEAVFREIVEYCPNLEELKLRNLHIPTPIFTIVQQSRSSVPLLSLRSLTLTFDLGTFDDLVEGDYVYVLSRIVAPSLEYLEVDVGKLLVDLGNILPPPSSLPALRRVCIHNMGPSFFLDTDYFDELSFGRIEEIRLVNAQPEPLGLDCSASKSQWAHLKKLSIDTQDAADLVWLCEAIMLRPQIRTVCLSKSALKELRENVVMIQMSSDLFWVGIRSCCHTLQGWEFAEEGYQMCAEGWLRSRIALKA
ncbi:hypothetical protein PQX77_007834 [Marasmius sp. AFHP31]|nr:hypothetical protein PQX77_007834 [Marasmius sp. AFHP31]